MFTPPPKKTRLVATGCNNPRAARNVLLSLLMVLSCYATQAQPQGQPDCDWPEPNCVPATWLQWDVTVPVVISTSPPCTTSITCIAQHRCNQIEMMELSIPVCDGPAQFC
jgi:hypothetical protein